MTNRHGRRARHRRHKFRREVRRVIGVLAEMFVLTPSARDAIRYPTLLDAAKAVADAHPEYCGSRERRPPP